MLTQDQLNQLDPLTQHPKYGQLLKNAIETWKYEQPITGRMGIIFSSKSKRFEKSPVDGCCLLGASICNKNAKFMQFIDDIQERYNLSCNEYYSLINAFDGCDAKWNNEAYNFAQKVRYIVKPKND